MKDHDQRVDVLVEHRRRIDQALIDLRTRYPYQFPESLPLYMFEPEPGWVPLIEALCHNVDRILPPELRQTFAWRQIKEKFGTLRAYWSFGPQHFDIQPGSGVISGQIARKRPSSYESAWEAIEAAIRVAKQQSAQTCGACGAPGRHRSGDWQRTLCDRHAADQ